MTIYKQKTHDSSWEELYWAVTNYLEGSDSYTTKELKEMMYEYIQEKT